MSRLLLDVFAATTLTDAPDGYDFVMNARIATEWALITNGPRQAVSGAGSQIFGAKSQDANVRLVLEPQWFAQPKTSALACANQTPELPGSPTDHPHKERNETGRCNSCILPAVRLPR